MMPEISAATVDITPAHPLELGGYHSRRNHAKTTRKTDPLSASGLLLQQGDLQTIIISYDLIWLSYEFCYHVKQWISSQYQLPPSRVLLCATHTHSSPQIMEHASYYGQPDEQYIAELTEKSKVLINNLIENPEPAEITFRRTQSSWNGIINRNKVCRNLFTGRRQCIHSPNPAATHKHHFDMITCRNASGNIKAMIVKLACHPVFHKRNRFSADFPGYLRQLIHQKTGQQFPVIFLQGFAGDLRPNYPARTLRERAEQFLDTKSLHNGFAKHIESKQESFCHSLLQMLPLQTANTHYLTNADENAYSIIEISPWEKSATVDQHLLAQRFDLSSKCSIVALNGEIFAEHETILRNLENQLDHIIIPVGYANGMIGYLPDRKTLNVKNGYEYKSWGKFGLAQPLPEKLPEQIGNTLKNLFNQ